MAEKARYINKLILYAEDKYSSSQSLTVSYGWSQERGKKPEEKETNEEVELQQNDQGESSTTIDYDSQTQENLRIPYGSSHWATQCEG